MIYRYHPSDNDGRFPEGVPVLVRFPLHDDDNDRDAWPWLPGTVLEQCDGDEWYVVVEESALAEPDPAAPDRDWLYPACFRDSSEIRPAWGE
ncbi:hypothetical protein [Nonomuraea longicatena]